MPVEAIAAGVTAQAEQDQEAEGREKKARPDDPDVPVQVGHFRFESFELFVPILGGFF